MRNMNGFQLAFWRELLAPFADNELSTVKKGGGRELTYVDSRALFNRLDSVCGPAGWNIEYRQTERGYTARVGIEVPDAENRFVFMYKEDGGGFEDMGMKNRDTGEWEADIDNDEKSAYTNAARRAIQNAWGIGRYLYRKGIPTWLDPNARPAANAPPAPQAPAIQPPPDRERTTRDHTETNGSVAAETPKPQPPAPAKVYDNFKIPKPGKQVFAWAKEMEKTFDAKLTDGMASAGESKGCGRTFADWNDDQVREIVMGCINYIRTLPTYKGQYEYLNATNAATPEPVKQTPSNATPATTNPAPGVNIADLRRTLMVRMQAISQQQTGRAAEPHELRQAFAKIAPLCKTGEGKTGEVAESLGKLTDVAWINNMIAFMDHQIAMSVADNDPGDDPIPF